MFFFAKKNVSFFWGWVLASGDDALKVAVYE